MPSATVRKLRPPLSQTFGGLWLSRTVLAPTENDLRATLFMRGKRLDYMLSWVLNVCDPAERDEDEDDEDFTHPWLIEIRAAPSSIHMHLAGRDDGFFDPDMFDIDVPWKEGQDGSLILEGDEGNLIYYPTTFDEMYRLGFHREVVEETLEHKVTVLGLEYQLEPRIPVFPP